MATPILPPPSASLEGTRLKGHLGHLTPKEEAAFATFKNLCAEQGFYKPDDGVEPASHDDGTLMYVFVFSSLFWFYQFLSSFGLGSGTDRFCVCVCVCVFSRYLRARRFVPADAFAQFKDTEIWRKENKLDALYENIDIQDYQEARSVVCYAMLRR